MTRVVIRDNDHVCYLDISLSLVRYKLIKEADDVIAISSITDMSYHVRDWKFTESPYYCT